MLSWLLGETLGDVVRRHLEDASTIVTSDLTLVECDRAIIRSMALGGLDASRADELHTALAVAARTWNILRIAQPVVARARGPFPLEPVRSLDALHIASALLVREALSELALLSLDERVRKVGLRLGFELLPA